MKVDNKLQRRIVNLGALLAAVAALAFPMFPANAKLNAVELTQKNAEHQIRQLIEPLLDKYCRDQCKLLSVNVAVDLAVPDEVAPGFDEIQVSREGQLAPSSARIKLLMDDKVGPVSRGKLVELLQRHLDSFDYSVKIDTQLSHFPQPIGSEGKVAELRERVYKQFQNSVHEILNKYCGDSCILADLNLQTEVVNAEEAQYGQPGEFIQEGGVALRIKDVTGTLLMDENLSAEERNNILEMTKVKTKNFRNVSLQASAMKFPRPSRGESAYAGLGGEGNGIGGGRSVASNQKSDSESKSQLNETKTSESNATNSSSTNSTSNSTNQQQSQSNTSSSNTTNNESNSNKNESTLKQEKFERIEKIERVENGDAVQAELQKFKVYGLIFGCSILSLLVFIAMASFRPRRESSAGSTIHRVISNLASDPITQAPTPIAEAPSSGSGSDERMGKVQKRYEIERLVEELSSVFAQHPRVAKQVFSRVLTEEGVEVTAQYIHIFGESVVVEMLRDPSLQSDLQQLMDYYAKTPIEIEDEEKLDLLRRLHSRTVAGKLVVMGNRSSNLFDFLAEMDSTQISEMIRTESLTVKAIILTQCDAQKRGNIYAHLDEDTRMKLLAELSRIDYLPRDYIFNVSNALKRKRRDNPKLNTEALPGSEVLVSLLERTGTTMQRTVVQSLETSNPESARLIKSKLVSIDTLRYLRDGQLLEVVLSLRHDELLQFLKGASESIRNAIFAKSPKELVIELEEELVHSPTPSRETYQAVERKVLNRMKLMANDGLINLIETNERMFSDGSADNGFVAGGPAKAGNGEGGANIKKVSGW